MIEDDFHAVSFGPHDSTVPDYYCTFEKGLNPLKIRKARLSARVALVNGVSGTERTYYRKRTLRAIKITSRCHHPKLAKGENMFNIISMGNGRVSTQYERLDYRAIAFMIASIKIGWEHSRG